MSAFGQRPPPASKARRNGASLAIAKLWSARSGRCRSRERTAVVSRGVCDATPARQPGCDGQARMAVAKTNFCAHRISEDTSRAARSPAAETVVGHAGLERLEPGAAILEQDGGRAAHARGRTRIAAMQRRAVDAVGECDRGGGDDQHGGERDFHLSEHVRSPSIAGPSSEETVERGAYFFTESRVEARPHHDNANAGATPRRGARRQARLSSWQSCSFLLLSSGRRERPARGPAVPRLGHGTPSPRQASEAVAIRI